MDHGRLLRRPAWGKIFAVALALAALTAAWRWTPLSEYVNGEHIVAWARAVRGRPWAPVLLVLAYVPTAFVMLPRPVLTLIGVMAFGPWLGFAYAMAGVLLSALCTYYLGRMATPEQLRRFSGGHFERVRGLLAEHSFAAMFALRIAPLAPFIVGSVLAGAARANVLGYSSATLLGMAPGILATSVFGAQITTALEDPALVDWRVLAAAAAGLGVATWLALRWLRRQSARP